MREEIEYEQKQKEKARKARERSQAKKRLADYWQEHAEEKASLEAEQTELKTKAAELDQALADLENDPDAVAHGREYDRLSDREEELMKQRVRLNIFQGGKTPLSLCSRSTDKGFRNLLNVLYDFFGEKSTIHKTKAQRCPH